MTKNEIFQKIVDEYHIDDMPDDLCLAVDVLDDVIPVAEVKKWRDDQRKLQKSFEYHWAKLRRNG